MRHLKGKLNLYLLTISFLLSTQFAHAYIDPGTGSYILQILLAGILGAAFAIKMFWKNIKAFLTKLFNKDDSE